MNFIRVTDYLYRGDRPKTEEDIFLLRTNCIGTIIDLQTGIDTNLTFLASGLGIVTIDFNLCPVVPPINRMVTRIINTIEDRVTRPPFFIHCRSGVDRTGFVIARYRMKEQGWTKEMAAQEMKDMGNHWWLAWWRLFL